MAPTEIPSAQSGIEAAAAAVGWQPRADYPTNVYEAVSAAYTNPSTLKATLYVIGGALKQGGPAGSLTDAVRAYDVSANTWSTKAKLPVVLKAANQAVQLNGKIYVSGGFTRYRDPNRDIWRLSSSSALYVYDIATNTWTRKADMPRTAVQGIAAAYNGFIYVAVSCGDETLCGSNFRGAVWRYNPGTDRWVLETLVPNGVTWRAAGGVIGGKLYVVDEMGATDIYDLTTKVWTSGPQRPFRRCTGTSTTFQAKVYIANCANDDGSDESMLVLDPQTNAWTQLPPAPEGAYATMARVGVNGRNRLELVGGVKAGSNWQYTP